MRRGTSCSGENSLITFRSDLHAAAHIMFWFRTSETLRNLHQGGGDGKHLRISLKQEVSEPVGSSKVLSSEVPVTKNAVCVDASWYACINTRVM